MKKLRKLCRLCGFILLMVLAGMGIGLTGAAPVLPKNREIATDNKPKIELVEEKDDTTPMDGSTINLN